VSGWLQMYVAAIWVVLLAVKLVPPGATWVNGEGRNFRGRAGTFTDRAQGVLHSDPGSTQPTCCPWVHLGSSSHHVHHGLILLAAPAGCHVLVMCPLHGRLQLPPVAVNRSTRLLHLWTTHAHRWGGCTDNAEQKVVTGLSAAACVSCYW
jgi:hypothetical protein